MSSQHHRTGAAALWTTAIAGFIAAVAYPPLAAWDAYGRLYTLIVGAAVALSIAAVGSRLAEGTRAVSRAEVRRVGDIVDVADIIHQARTTTPPRRPTEVIRLELDGEPVIIGADAGAMIDPAAIRRTIHATRRGGAS